MNSEVLVIGGGVIGLSIARSLHKKGFGKITLVERDICGMGATNAAAGMLAPRSEATKDDAFFRFCSASRDAYPQFAAELFDETGIDVELDRTGTLHPAFTEEDSRLIRTYADWQSKAGINPELLSAVETLAAEPELSPTVRESLFYPDDWQVENRKLAAALKKYAEINSITIRENTPVDRINIENGKAVGAVSGGERFDADNTIIATGAWTSFIRFQSEPSPIAIEPVRGQMICYRPAEKLFRHVIFSERGYMVPRRDGRLLVGATVEHCGFDDSVTKAALIALRRAAAAIAPKLADEAIVEEWAGLRPEAADGRPVIGAIPGIENLFAATGHFRNGILLAPATADVIAEMLAGDANLQAAEAFTPERFF